MKFQISNCLNFLVLIIKVITQNYSKAIGSKYQLLELSKSDRQYDEIYAIGGKFIEKTQAGMNGTGEIFVVNTGINIPKN